MNVSIKALLLLAGHFSVACATAPAALAPSPTIVPPAKETSTNTPEPSPTITPTLAPTITSTLAPTNTPTEVPSPGYDGCKVISPPEDLAVDPFYEKHCLAVGIPILSSGGVPDLALQVAADIVIHMVADMPDVRRAMIDNGLLVGVIAANQVTTDMPEYRNLNDLYPEVDWDQRTRGLAATTSIPLSTGAEENLLCYSTDRYLGESIFLHEFAHTIMDLGLVFVDASFLPTVQGAFDEAMSRGLWRDTYAAANVAEYWAEGVQSYFDTNLQADPPNGIHNFVNTREELLEYDPKLAEIISGVFGSPDWRVSCQ